MRRMIAVLAFVLLTTLVGTTPALSHGDKCHSDKHVKENETIRVHAGCRVKGDIELWNGHRFVRLYDKGEGSEKTGLVTSCTKSCKIHAPFGANVTPRSVSSLKRELMRTGCGGHGCESVKVVVFPHKGKPTKGVCNKEIASGHKLLIRGSCRVSGDIEVSRSKDGDYTALYDDKSETGTLLRVPDGHKVWVRAPFSGASANSRSVDENVSSMKKDGCGQPNGCSRVQVWKWPGLSSEWR
jgi:hypothetical protein